MAKIKKSVKLNFIIPLVIYPFDVMVSFFQTDEELKNSLKKFGTEWSDKMICVGKGKFYMNELNQSLIRLNIIPETCEDYGTLAHEIFHCITYILDRIGMKFKLQTSDESYSYLIGYLTTKIYEKINQ